MMIMGDRLWKDPPMTASWEVWDLEPDTACIIARAASSVSAWSTTLRYSELASTKKKKKRGNFQNKTKKPPHAHSQETEIYSYSDTRKTLFFITQTWEARIPFRIRFGLLCSLCFRFGHSRYKSVVIHLHAHTDFSSGLLTPLSHGHKMGWEKSHSNYYKSSKLFLIRKALYFYSQVC